MSCYDVQFKEMSYDFLESANEIRYIAVWMMWAKRLERNLMRSSIITIFETQTREYEKNLAYCVGNSKQLK